MMSGGLVPRSLLWGLLLPWAVSEFSAVVAQPETPGEHPEYCTVYLHMVKSGGTTIKDQMIEASGLYGDQLPGVQCSMSASLVPGMAGACGSSLYTNKVITSAFGELLRLPLEETGRFCEYFTMVRHPIDRLVSAFFYCPTDHDLNRRPSKWCAGAQDEATARPLLLEYATTHWKNIAFNQMILGTLCPPRYSAMCSDQQKIGHAPNDLTSPEALDLLERAQATLASYKAVGIFEHFALSMELFGATVTSPVRDWTASKMSNPGKQSDLRQNLLDWANVNTELRRYLAPDLMIYDMAVSVFQQQTTAALGTEW